MRWLRLFTPVTELSLLPEIHSLPAFLQRESFSGKRLYGLPSGGPFASC